MPAWRILLANVLPFPPPRLAVINIQKCLDLSIQKAMFKLTLYFHSNSTFLLYNIKAMFKLTLYSHSNSTFLLYNIKGSLKTSYCAVMQSKNTTIVSFFLPVLNIDF